MAFPTHIVAAAGYVFDPDGNLLIIQTPNRGWDCPGGQIEPGEDLETGLLREILEESGIQASITGLCAVYSNVGQYTFYDGVTPVPTKVMFDFICACEGGACRPSDESHAVRWVPQEQVMAYLTNPMIRYRFEKALHFDGHITYASYVTRPAFQVLKERTF